MKEFKKYVTVDNEVFDSEEAAREHEDHITLWLLGTEALSEFSSELVPFSESGWTVREHVARFVLDSPKLYRIIHFFEKSDAASKVEVYNTLRDKSDA